MPFGCTQSSHESVPKEKAQYQIVSDGKLYVI